MTELSDLNGKTSDQIDDWFGTRGVGKHIFALQAENTRLLAKVSYLKKVLSPFAQAAETWLPEEPDDKTWGARVEHPKYGMEPHACFTFGDLFRARDALEDDQ